MQTRTIEVPEGLVKHDGKYWFHVDCDGFRGYRPWNFDAILGIETKEKVSIAWVGSQIPISIWHQITAFFEVQFDKTGGEGQVRLFYNPKTGEWKAWAFPQEWSSGMTTKEIADHPDRAKQSEALGADFVCYGSVHHHCRGGAFQSGTDTEDERSQNGLHITVGHIGANEYDLDGRVYFGGIKYNCVWPVWFAATETPEWVNLLKGKNREDALNLIYAVNWTEAERVLKVPAPKNTLFPKAWIDNLIKTQWNGGGHNGRTFRSEGSPTYQGGYGSHYGTRQLSCIPTPVQFKTTVEALLRESGMPEGTVQSLLEEVGEHGIITTGRAHLEEQFLKRFGAIAGACGIFPPRMAARYASQILWPEEPRDNDGKALLQSIALCGGDAGLYFSKMMGLMCLLVVSPNMNGETDDERSCIQHLRQLAAHSKKSMAEIAEFFFEYCTAEYFTDLNLEADQKAATQELIQQQQNDNAYAEGHPWGHT